MKHCKTLLSIASILAIAIFVAACGSENTPQTTSEIITGSGNSQEAVLQDILPDPSRITLTPVSSAQISIVGSYSDGTRSDITADIDWSPYNGNLAYGIDNNGFITAYSSGVFDLQITHQGLTNEITIDIIGVTEDPLPEDPILEVPLSEAPLPEDPVQEDLIATGSGISAFVENPMIIGGIVDSAKWGSVPTIVDGNLEHISYSRARTIPTNQLMVFLRNDSNSLYGLVDVLGDETDDSMECTWRGTIYGWGCDNNDYFYLFADNDANGVITPFVDYHYNTCSSIDYVFTPPNYPPVGYITLQTARLSRSNILSNSGGSNGCDSGGATSGSHHKGFGVTHNSNRTHRYFEFSIPLNELCIADDGTAFLNVGYNNNNRTYGNSVPIRLSNVSGNGCPSASAYMKIRYSEEVCGSLFPPLMRMVYAENTHPTFSIEADIFISDRNSLNQTTPVTRTYNIPPKELVQLGCTAQGLTLEDWQQWEYEPTQVYWSHE